MKLTELSNIRRQNLGKVLDLLTVSPAMTRQQLADATHLSQMTVTNLVDLLKEQGVLQFMPAHREGIARPALGRKADAISLCSTQKAWLLADISNRQFSLTLLGFDVSVLMELHDDGHGDYLPRLEAFLRDGIRQVRSALGSRELLGVAIVTPGPYEISSDTVQNQRLPQLNGVRIKELFRRCMGHYEYYVDEDVKFAVRAFSDLIAQTRSEVLYYLYIGEGVGGAAVHGGNMLRGLNATAGDPGHLRSREGDTYESRLSTGAFSRLLGQSDALAPDALARFALQEPARYAAALEQMAGITAEMLHGVLWMLDPTHIIIDCIYARPMEDMFLQAVSGHMRALFSADERMLPQLFPGASGLSSVLRGAVRVLQKAWLERMLT